MPAEQQKQPVKNIVENREFVVDNFYGTGRWDKEQVKLVDPMVAVKLLRHNDVWANASTEEAVSAISIDVKQAVDKTKEQQEEELSQSLRDKVNTMSRDDVIDYAAVHYSMKIAGNSSVEKARELLIQHIDLAGPA